MSRRNKVFLRWLLAAGAAGALIGGAASAMEPENCLKIYPCGCASDGGYMYCTKYVAC